MSQIEDIKPLLVQWLTLWKNLASKTGSRMEYVYNNALKSLRSYEEPVTCAKDCQKIKYFGEKICQRVKDSLRDHYNKLGIPYEDDDDDQQTVTKTSKTKSKKPATTGHDADEPQSSQSSQAPAKKAVQRKRNYIPAPRSGAFAILVTLIQAEKDGISKLTKTQIIQDAQEYCDESMSKSKAGSFYSGFSSMKTLINKELICEERHRNSEYFLTESGRELAEKLLKYVLQDNPINNQTNLGDDDQFNSQSSQKSSSSVAGDFQLTDFDIVLIVDTRETTSGVDSNLKKTSLMAHLTQSLNVPVEMRALPAGDFAWIARERLTSVSKPSSQESNSGQVSTMSGHFQATKKKFTKQTSTNKVRRELLFDYVIERKRVDDLASSIADGRFHEQKHRLKVSGIRKPIYLVECLTKGEYTVPYRNLLQAVHNSQVIDGFNVKYTKDHSETISYLITMTKALMKKYSRQTLFSCPREELVNKPDNYLMTYSEYQTGSTKMTNFTVSEMFLKQLLSFSGMSVSKAKAIIERYPTMGSLIEAYEACQEDGKKGLKERINLIATVKEFGNSDRNIGPALGKKLMLTYCRDADKFT